MLAVFKFKEAAYEKIRVDFVGKLLKTNQKVERSASIARCPDVMDL